MLRFSSLLIGFKTNLQEGIPNAHLDEDYLETHICKLNPPNIDESRSKVRRHLRIKEIHVPSDVKLSSTRLEMGTC
jgi:F420-0:gamma-glutamyl ligase